MRVRSYISIRKLMKPLHIPLAAPKRSFLRRTKATAPPDTAETESSTDKTETTTNKFTRRGSSKFKSRKEAELEKKGSTTKNEVENASRRPSLSGGARRSERPTRKFVRVRPGGVNVTSTTAAAVSASSSSPLSAVTRRPFRVTARRRLGSTTTTTTTSTAPPTTAEAQAATSAYEDEESLQDIGDIDVIEDPTLEPKVPKKYNKVQRRPLVNLKEDVKDQNPSATNEEERKRQSKKYSSTIKQNQLDDLIKSRSQEETTTEAKSTADEINSETALALAAHQLITAPLPSVQDFEDDVKPTRKTQTTVEYKYTSREYSEQTDSRTPTYDEYSTPVYKTTLGSFDKTQPDFDSTKVTSDFNVLKSPVTSTGAYRSEYTETAPAQTFTSEFDAPKISTTTYDVPKTTAFPNTVNTANTANLDFIRTTSEYSAPSYLPKATNFPNTAQDFVRTTLSEFYDTRSDFDAKISSYLPKTNFVTNTGPQEFGRTASNTYPDTSTDYVAKTYVPKFPSTDYPNTINQEYVRTTLNTFDASPTELNSPRISTTLAPPSSTPARYFERTTFSNIPTENSPRTITGFSPRSTASTKFSRNGSRYSGATNEDGTGSTGVQRGSTQRYRTEKLIPVPVESTGFTTVGYSSPSQEPTYFTREYLLESPVTKTYDEEYQYLSPITTPQTPATPTRKVIRKKIQRKISTTQQPTTQPPSTTTPKPRRGPPKQPFEKIAKLPKKTYRPIANYDYYDDSDEKVAVKYVEGTKVVMRSDGHIECLDIGNFPHPSSCKKFISCARIENGSLLGWEYVCPKGLSFDPVGGICNWSAGLGCDEKDA
ncbi:unnamed protein product [Chrysodeixis includens]|uniref:Chitin-binding type-2 domain-containing protein n=1 Tax=Chrysodeixis includens TaxID=689277 RepID=A0A9N8L2S5_CHRIL|nr:unnamed protein product [Chrysodeixis includens]